MASTGQIETAALEAEKLIRELEIDKLPIRPVKICRIIGDIGPTEKYEGRCFWDVDSGRQ